MSRRIVLLAVSLVNAAPAPEFSLNEYKGKVVLLNFWATSCGACKLQLPWLAEFHDKYKNSGLFVIGLSTDEDGWKSVRPFLKRHKFSYPILIASERLIKLHAVEAIPVTVLIDRQGKIAASHTGLIDKAAFENQIRVLLSAKIPTWRENPR